MLIDLIKEYYENRKLPYPNFDNAMKFVMTEIAEVYELDLARIGGWVRNNPEDKPTYSKEKMAEELGDAIMMLIVAGIAEGVDPVEALESKIRRKLNLPQVTISKEGVAVNGIGITYIPAKGEIITEAEFEKYRNDIYEGKA